MAGTILTLLQVLLVSDLQSIFSKRGSYTMKVEPCFSFNFLSDVDDVVEGELKNMERTVPPAKFISLLNSTFDACGGQKVPYRKKSHFPNNPGSCKKNKMHTQIHTMCHNIKFIDVIM